MAGPMMMMMLLFLLSGAAFGRYSVSQHISVRTRLGG